MGVAEHRRCRCVERCDDLLDDGRRFDGRIHLHRVPRRSVVRRHPRVEGCRRLAAAGGLRLQEPDDRLLNIGVLTLDHALRIAANPHRHRHRAPDIA